MVAGANRVAPAPPVSPDRPRSAAKRPPSAGESASRAACLCVSGSSPAARRSFTSSASKELFAAGASGSAEPAAASSTTRAADAELGRPVRLGLPEQQVEHLPLKKQLLYAVGQLGWSALSGLVGLQLVYFYLPPDDPDTDEPVIPIHVTQNTFGYIFNVITLLASAGRLWDAVTDPLIASWSDRLVHRRGRRIPFLFAGGVPACVFCALMFVPIVDRESGWNVAWLALTQTLFYLFITVYCSPYAALLSELGHTAEERLNLSTWIAISFAIGTVLAAGPAGAPVLASTFSEWIADAFLGSAVPLPVSLSNGLAYLLPAHTPA